MSLRSKRNSHTALRTIAQESNNASDYRSPAELKEMYRAERRVKKAGMGRVIASRTLNEENARATKIKIQVGAPRRIQTDHWLCPFAISGIVDSGIHYAYGVDALQALTLAIGGLRYHLDNTGRHFNWLGDDHGIPQQVSMNYGRTYAQRVARAIERESKRAQTEQLRARKAELAAAVSQLKVLKKGTAKWREPVGKADLKAEISRQEAKIKTAKRILGDWEARLRKWKP